jgi:hypothetical protein
MEFPEVVPVPKMRRCLLCNIPFYSSSAAERVCPVCRRSFRKAQKKYDGISITSMTPAIERHVRNIEEDTVGEGILKPSDVNAFLNGNNEVDDSAVYKVLLERESKTDAMLLAEKVLAEFITVKEDNDAGDEKQDSGNPRGAF